MIEGKLSVHPDEWGISQELKDERGHAVADSPSAEDMQKIAARYNAFEPGGLVERYQALHDGLSDMIEGGRLKREDIPDDYRWLVESLAALGAHPNNQQQPQAGEEA